MNDQEPTDLDLLEENKVIYRKEDRKETESRQGFVTGKKEQDKIIIDSYRVDEF
jgi:hypothetical protein